MIDLLATGYPSLDYIFPVSHNPGMDETAIIRILPGSYTFGGCGANVATALAHIGFSTALAMILGDDEAGHDYLQYLGEQGIDTRDVQIVSGEITSQSWTFLNPDGHYQNYFFPGACDSWKGRLRLHSLNEAQTVLLTVGPPQYNRAFIDQVLKRNLPLIWQLKSDVYSHPYEQLERLVSSSRILFMNRAEAEFLTQQLDTGGVHGLLCKGPQIAVITKGSEGSLVIDAHGEEQVPAVRPRRVLDSTGAGDGYTAGFLAGWLNDLSPQVCGKIGATIASFVVEEIGCQTNFPDRRQLSERYQSFFEEPLPLFTHEE
jgi:sugar/nucleoside kinase (ribokinase family)